MIDKEKEKCLFLKKVDIHPKLVDSVFVLIIIVTGLISRLAVHPSQ